MNETNEMNDLSELEDAVARFKRDLDELVQSARDEVNAKQAQPASEDSKIEDSKSDEFEPQLFAIRELEDPSSGSSRVPRFETLIYGDTLMLCGALQTIFHLVMSSSIDDRHKRDVFFRMLEDAAKDPDNKYILVDILRELQSKLDTGEKLEVKKSPSSPGDKIIH